MKPIYLLILILSSLLAHGCATARAHKVASGKPMMTRQKVLFDFNRSSVRPADKTVLEALASQMRREDKTIAILEGHTDLIGSAYYNEILAEKRARSVRVFLRDLGVDPMRTTILSKGKREPAVKGNSKAAHQANRRVEILVTLGNDNQKKKNGRKL